jgi:hypothetical protein
VHHPESGRTGALRGRWMKHRKLVQNSQGAGDSWEKPFSSKAGNWEKKSSKGTGSPGGEWALGTGRTLASLSLRCPRILRVTLGASIEAMTRIRLRHRGQTKGVRFVQHGSKHMPSRQLRGTTSDLRIDHEELEHEAVLYLLAGFSAIVLFAAALVQGFDLGNFLDVLRLIPIVAAADGIAYFVFTA